MYDHIVPNLSEFISQTQLLITCQIGFRSGYSIWNALLDLESRINISRQNRQYAALVKLHIWKAYDSVEPAILTDQLWYHEFPGYIVAWVENF